MISARKPCEERLATGERPTAEVDLIIDVAVYELVAAQATFERHVAGASDRKGELEAPAGLTRCRNASPPLYSTSMTVPSKAEAASPATPDSLSPAMRMPLGSNTS